jgi:ubiquinone/menaquinone biosynthesis C-methylase UbiE
MNTDRPRQHKGIITDEEWATRHLREENWVEIYWKSRDDPHRLFLVEKICKYVPINSVLEIGCASGPNLYHFAEKFPEADVRGIDISPVAVQKGNEFFREEGFSNVKLEVGKAQDLKRFADKTFDVVFTDAVLIYISPEEIKQTIKEMLRIGRIVVLTEWHTFNKWRAFRLNTFYYFKSVLTARQQFKTIKFSPISKAPLGLFVGHWARDYRSLFGEFVQKGNVHITKLPKEIWNDKGWQRWGAIIEVRG